MNRANAQLKLGPLNEFGELADTKLKHFAKMSRFEFQKRLKVISVGIILVNSTVNE